MIALYTFRHWLKKPTWLLSVLAGVTLGLLPLTKLTWIIAFGIFPILWFLTSQKSFKNLGQLIIILIIGIFVLNFGYCFDGSFKRFGDYTFYSDLLTNENSVNKFSETWLGLIPVPLPEQFVLGFDTQQVDFEQGILSYCFGQYSQHGWWYYYLVVLATKETLGTLILLGLALVLFFFKQFRTTWKDEIVLLVPFIMIFVIVSSQTGFSLHSRYMIPALPFLYLWISRVGILLSSRFIFVRVIVPVILLFGTISSLCVYPYSMSYFNEAVGGSSQGHRYLLGSNIDWGQDLYELRDWLADHPESRPIRVAVSNIYPLETLDIRGAGTPPKWKPDQKPTGTWDKQLTIGPQPGWYLLGTNDLYNVDHDYDWFHDLIPVKKIGYSIYIFQVTLEDANRLREQYDLPMFIEEDFE
jgi:4-amino-4-deoxy-L-arabinose transferase-like glycosyltransferase